MFTPTNTTIERNFLLLTRVRLVVKFYIWPLLVLFGLTGNFISIFVLTRRRLRRTSTNNYLTILALCDSCYLILTLILNFGSHDFFSQYSFTQTLLFILRPLADFSSNTATWLIVCFTLERTLAVTRPIYAKRTCSVRRSRHLICFLLVICFLITLPTYFEQNFVHNLDQTESMNQTNSSHIFLVLHRFYLVFICVVIIWIPLTLLCICNSILIWYVHRSRRFDIESSPTFNPFSTESDLSPINQNKFSFVSTMPLKTSYTYPLRRHSRSDVRKRKVTIVLIFCLFVALLLWTPQSLSLTYETMIESYVNMSPERRIILLIFNNFANLFLCINASIDFILYCFLSEKFARTCRQILWRQCLAHKTNASQRSRMFSLDRPSFLYPVTTTAAAAARHIHQQQLIAANTTNNYYSQLYPIFENKNKKWKKKFVQTLSPATSMSARDHRIFYQTSLHENKKRFLNSANYQTYEQETKSSDHSIEILSQTDEDFIKTDLNASIHSSNSSLRQAQMENLTII